MKESDLDEFFVCLIDKLKEDKEHNYSHVRFYKMLINELNYYKEENQFYDNILVLENYALQKRYEQ